MRHSNWRSCLTVAAEVATVLALVVAIVALISSS